MNGMDLDGAVAEFVRRKKIPIFGIANAQEFADALPGWHRKELMPKCESVIGSYYRVGVLLTEAKLTPTNRTRLDDFYPCEGCSECGEVCPIKAIDVSREPGAGYDRERCMRFIMKMSERSGTKAYICSQFYSLCPWSMGRRGTTPTEKVQHEKRLRNVR